jgi:cephalosporin hydroxylase
MKKISLKKIEDFILAAGSDDLATFGGSFEGGIHCQQIPDEIAPCIHKILESGVKVRNYIEIGVAAGGTAFLFDHFFNPDLLVLVDDNRHHKAGLRPDILKDVPTHEIVGRSDDEVSVAAAAALAPYDVVVIDGDHLYPGVKIDTLLYLPMLRTGGFLVLHDSAMAEWGVARVVRELRTDPDMEMVAEWWSQTQPKPLGVALFRRKA